MTATSTTSPVNLLDAKYSKESLSKSTAELVCQDLHILLFALISFTICSLISDTGKKGCNHMKDILEHYLSNRLHLVFDE